MARTTHPRPAKKKDKKKSTSSTKDLPPRLNKPPPGQPRQYPLQRASYLVVVSAPSVASTPSPVSGTAGAPPIASLAPTVMSLAPPAAADFASGAHSDVLEGNQGQKLSDEEILVYADEVAHRKSIGKIYTHPQKGAVLEPVKADLKPTGESLNNAESWTAFGLAAPEQICLERILVRSFTTLVTMYRTIAQRSLPSDDSLSPSAIMLNFRN
jgi:hypothetical protein